MWFDISLKKSPPGHKIFAVRFLKTNLQNEYVTFIFEVTKKMNNVRKGVIATMFNYLYRSGSNHSLDSALGLLL